MTTPVAASLMTAEEFLRFPEEECYELVDGELKEKSMGGISGWLGGELHVAMRDVANASAAGFAFGDGQGIAVWPDNPLLVRKPDAMFIRREHLPQGLPSGWFSVVPDIAAEVVSPNDEVEALNRKLFDYRRAGVPLVWVIHPDTRTAYAHRGERIEFIDTDGVLDGGDILPGFRLPLADLFATLPPAQEPE